MLVMIIVEVMRRPLLVLVDVMRELLLVLACWAREPGKISRAGWDARSKDEVVMQELAKRMSELQ
jgi:hypothetical protein